MKQQFLRCVLIVILGLLLAPSVMMQDAFAKNVPNVPTHGHPRLLPMVEFDGLPLIAHTAQTNPPGDFPFQTAKSTDGLLVVHYYGRSADYGQSILTIISGYLQHPIKDTLGYGPARTINVYIYNSRNDFLAGVQPPDPAETGAISYFHTSSIYLPLDVPDDLGAYMPHELTHIVFHQHGDVGHIQSQEIRFYPLWLDEGLAEYDVPLDNIATLDDAYFLAQAVNSRSLVNVFSVFINDYPTDVNVNHLYYAESRFFITYLVKTYGLTKFHQFVDGLKDGEINLAAMTFFGSDLQALQSQWEVSLGLPAIAHDKEIPLVVPSSVSFDIGGTSTTVTQTKPFAVPGDADVQTNMLIIEGIFLGLAMLLILAEVLVRLRRKRSAVVMPVAVAVAAQEAGWSSGEDVSTAPLPAIASDRGPSTAPKPSVFPWLTVVVLGLLAPLAVGVSYLWQAIDTSMLWRHRFIATELVVGVALLALVALAIVAWQRKHLSFIHIGGVLVALALLPTFYVLGNSIGRTQGLAYENAGAYALALSTLTDAGAEPKLIARVNGEWAAKALHADDYADASLHLRAAVTADPSNQAYRTQLLQTTTTWGNHLIAAHLFAQAIQAFDTQQSFTGCDSVCQPIVQEGDGQARLAESSDDLFRGQTSAALTLIQQVAQRDPQTAAAKTAQLVSAGQHNSLAAGIAAGSQGDGLAMNLLLLLAHAQYPHTLLATEASDVPESVTGTIRDVNGASTTKLRLFFLAFRTQAAAIAWYSGNTDTSLFKVATNTGLNGVYQVRLQPGYWYLPIWDDPSQQKNNYFNISSLSTYDVFTLSPYAPIDIGTITGY